MNSTACAQKTTESGRVPGLTALGLPAAALIHLGRLRGNLAVLRSALAPGVKVFAVVKADAYGHGLCAVGGALSEAGVDGLVVTTVAEGLALRGLGLSDEIIVLGPYLADEVGDLVAARLSPTWVNLAQLEWLAQAAEQQGVDVPVHLRVDLGKGGQGLDPDCLMPALTRMAALPRLKWASVFTHQMGAYRSDAALLAREREGLRQLLDSLREAGHAVPLVHSDSSAGLSMGHASVFGGAVRVGSLLYGLHMIAGAPAGIRPVMEVRARVTDVRMLEAGATLSYESGFECHKRVRMANVSIGFAQAGFLSRACGGGVLVRGVFLPILGRSFMNNLLIDASALPDISVGDEAMLLGSQGPLDITAEAIAAAAEIRPSAVPLSFRGLPRHYLGVSAPEAETRPPMDR